MSWSVFPKEKMKRFEQWQEEVEILGQENGLGVGSGLWSSTRMARLEGYEERRIKN